MVNNNVMLAVEEMGVYFGRSGLSDDYQNTIYVGVGFGFVSRSYHVYSMVMECAHIFSHPRCA